jgi:succinate-acetate transporter protein
VSPIIPQIATAAPHLGSPFPGFSLSLSVFHSSNSLLTERTDLIELKPQIFQTNLNASGFVLVYFTFHLSLCTFQKKKKNLQNFFLTFTALFMSKQVEEALDGDAIN